MKIVKFIHLLIALLMVSYVWGQTVVEPQSSPERTSFAIITDPATWQNCRTELQKYKEVLEREQLPAYIIIHDWEKPEQVREILHRLYREKHLEGTVLIGDVPIPMIRKAQHLTSAFKMDEEAFPMRESSVPSDRFYDDFDLKFDFLCRDSVHPLMFYYNLAADSPQALRCDIYSGRIKPLKDGSDPYGQIRTYLNKAVAAHLEENRLDQFVSYTGEGSYSNSLTAWQAEQQTLREQMPGVFDRWNTARFMRYSMWEYPKGEVIATLKREDLDLMIFHEHGMPDRQYISAIPRVQDLEKQLVFLSREFRSKLRRLADRKGDFQAQAVKWGQELQLDSAWFTGIFDPALMQEDSLADVGMGIVLEDVPAIAPQVRMVIFDACYNGDFREDDYIAGRYIFSGGKCAVAFANSVNVLQDKSANDLLGLLGLGTRVGLWAKQVNILESHIIGDPTFCFRSQVKEVACNEWLAHPQPVGVWERLLDSPYADLQNIALAHLFYQNFPGISDTLRHYFEVSPFAVVRYQCMTLLEQLNDRNFREVLKQGATDPYEFIRRIAIHRMGRVGAVEFLPFILDAYLNDELSARVYFNAGMSLQLYRWEDILPVWEKTLAASPVLEKENVHREFEQRFAKGQSQRFTEELRHPEGKEKEKLMNIRYLKNANYHPGIDLFVELLQDPAASLTLRKALAESLAWFTLSEQKGKIITACRELMQRTDEPADLLEEVRRTYRQLSGDIRNGN